MVQFNLSRQVTCRPKSQMPACVDPHPLFYSSACDIISFNGQGQLCHLYLVQRPLKPCQNEHDRVKDHAQLTQKCQ